MKMRSGIMAAAIALFVLAGCQKEEVATTASVSDKVDAKTISAKQPRYDYSQPIDKIVADATAQSSERIKKVFQDELYSIEVIPGTYLGEDDGKSICFWVGFVCEVIFTLDPEESQTYSGSYERPIGVVQAFENWPVARLATGVSYEKDKEGYTRIKHTFTD